MDFKGSNAELSQTVSIAPASAPIVLAGGASTLIGPFDVRTYASYYLKIGTSAGAQPSFQTVEVQLRWRDSLTGDPLYQDFAEWFADGTGTFAFSGSDLEVQDSMHGPVMEFTIKNNGTAAISITYTFIGTNRQLAAPFFRQGFGIDCILAKSSGSIGAGATITVPCFFGYGPCLVKASSGASAAALGVGVGFGTAFSIGSNGITYTIPSATTTLNTIAFPKRSGVIQLNNPGAGPVTYGFFVVQQLSAI